MAFFAGFFAGKLGRRRGWKYGEKRLKKLNPGIYATSGIFCRYKERV